MTAYSRIIVGVNTLEQSKAAINWAVADADARHIPIMLEYAIKPWAVPEPALLAGAYSWPELPVNTLFDIAEETLKHAEEYARSLSADVDVTTDAREGDVVSVLRAAAEPHDLIVIGTRDLGAVQSALFGSTGAGLAHASQTPFVVVRGHRPSSTNAPIVVGVNPTAASEPVLAAAFEQAAAHQRPLRAMMCWEPFYYSPQDRWRTGLDEVRAEAEVWLAEALAGWQETYPDVAVERDLEFEYPAAALIEASLTASLVVVGIGGSRISKMLGSVAMNVLQHADCPVEVVPR